MCVYIHGPFTCINVKDKERVGTLFSNPRKNVDCILHLLYFPEKPGLPQLGTNLKVIVIKQN